MYDKRMDVLDHVLAAGAAARLTRFVVVEDLALWTIRGPAALWASSHEPTVDDVPVHQLVEQGKIEVEQPVVPGWRSKLVSGLDCPWCTSTWLQLGMQTVTAILPRGKPRTAWRVLTGALTASWLLTRVGIELGDYETPYDEDTDPLDEEHRP